MVVKVLVPAEELVAFLEMLKKFPSIKLSGVYPD